MINFIILIMSLSLSFANLFLVRILFDNVDQVLEIRSILVIGLMLSPITIIGLDTVIGRLQTKVIEKLYHIFLLTSVLLTIIAIISANSIVNTILLAMTIGMTQFNAAIYLTEGKDISFKICSQISPKVIFIISLLITSTLSRGIDAFTSLNSILLILLNMLLYYHNSKSNKFSIRLTKQELVGIYRLSLNGLAALFVSDLFIRMPYLMALNGPAEISNEFDIATAFTSTWILPLAIATRIDEVKSHYNYARYKTDIQKKRQSIYLQVLVLVACSILVISVITHLSLIPETFGGIATAMISTAWPALLILLYPNVTRMYFLTKDHIFADKYLIPISVATIGGVLYAANQTASQLYLGAAIFLLIFLMYLILNSKNKT